MRRRVRSGDRVRRAGGPRGRRSAPEPGGSARPLHLHPRPAGHLDPAGPPPVSPPPQLPGVGIGNPPSVAGRQIGIAGHQPAAAAVREPARLRARRRLEPLGRRDEIEAHAPTLTAPGDNPREPPRAAESRHSEPAAPRAAPKPATPAKGRCSRAGGPRGSRGAGGHHGGSWKPQGPPQRRREPPQRAGGPEGRAQTRHARQRPL